MRRLLLAMVAVGLCAICTRASATCFKSGNFFISSSGPWPMSLTVTSGSPCEGSYQLGFPGTRLNVVSAPAHGGVSLHEGGHYTYVSSPGYHGLDTFTLKLCGRIQGGAAESCTDLKYTVTVE